MALPPQLLLPRRSRSPGTHFAAGLSRCRDFRGPRVKARINAQRTSRARTAPTLLYVPDSSLCAPDSSMRIRATGPLRFDGMRRLAGKTACCGARHTHLGVKWNYSKIPNRNNGLRGKSDHDCVLFVQHPLEKGRSRTVQSGSFVACAEVLGNCERATEGGIPRSSRFRWFA